MISTWVRDLRSEVRQSTPEVLLPAKERLLTPHGLPRFARRRRPVVPRAAGASALGLAAPFCFTVVQHAGGAHQGRPTVSPPGCG
ncbi:hypothetical protein HD597_000559 [Nonomuraea thailandensis]|uniref:Uncharacterized protein n=1 Tax=Nonomuraea thailandensis TaxID=1188745 RepID=A0A9X2GA01_9ACTN|nr:hypothetical protein [Nonomuraea thailandensis]